MESREGSRAPRRRREPPHDRRQFQLTLAAGLPAVIATLVLLWTGAHDTKTRWTVALIVVAAWIGLSVAARERVVRPLQTLSNLLAALREGDFSIRARRAASDDPLGLAYLEANALGQTLHEQRLGALEATALMQRVIESVDVVVFAFDAGHRLRLVNPAGERLLGRPAEQLIGREARQLGLDAALEGDTPRVIELALPGGRGRWEARRGTFRQVGQPHELLMLADVSRTLREEERLAWQRLTRVLSHEINNSLAPITSIAGSLGDLLQREPRPAGLDQDLKRGLATVASRAESLGRFMASYARLARLPRPMPARVDVAAWARRVSALETRVAVVVTEGPPVAFDADGDQLDQLLINLVRNAADAALESSGGVRVGWAQRNGWLEVSVEDDGPGLASTENLFVPFFTTKPGGSGVGLALSRQIAEGHGGTLTLENRTGASGCVARLRLPVRSPGDSGGLSSPQR